MDKINLIVEGLSNGLLNEMSMEQLQDKDVINAIVSKNYDKAIDLYIEKGGALGAGASPKRTITALKGKVIAKDPRFKDLDLNMVNDFEEKILKKHEEAKKAGKKIEKETQPKANLIKSKENLEAGPRPSDKKEEEKVVYKDKDFNEYINTFSQKIRNKYEEELKKDYEDGITIPKDYRKDDEWIEMSMSLFDNTKEGKKLNRFAQAISSREAREKVKRKPSKSGLEKEEVKKEYDEYGYPKESKHKIESEKEISELVKKASLIEIKDYDTPEDKEKKSQELLKIAEKILANRKVFVLKTEDGVFKKMPETTDELYPLAKAILDYKQNNTNPDLKKLLLSIKRVGTHDVSLIREKTKKRIDDEINVAFSEIDEINSKTTLEELKSISLDILKILKLSAKVKPVRTDFMDAPKYFNAINFLWMITYGALKEAPDVNPEDIKKHLLFIKKNGIKNLLDLKWAGEPNPGDAIMGKEKAEKEYGARLKENTNLKNNILKEVHGRDYDEDKNKKFFYNLALGFVNDYKIFKEDTASLYQDIFGVEYSIIFEELQENISILTEEVETLVEDGYLIPSIPKGGSVSGPGSNSFKSAAEKMREMALTNTAGNVNSPSLKNAAESAIKKINLPEKADTAKKVLNKTKEDLADYMNRKADATIKTAEKITKPAGNFLSSIWEKIKDFGASLAEKFPKLTEFLGKGINWITEHPLAVAGVAGGTMLLAKIIKSLKQKGDAKRAAKLQAILDRN